MKDPQPLDELLDGLLGKLGIARPMDVTRLVKDWAEVAGEPWATRCRPVLLRDGELLVEVDDGAAATLLKYHESDLVIRLGERLGKGLVTTVRVRLRRTGA